MITTPLSEQDTTLLDRAVALAQKGLFTTKPNPRVGCVIAREGKIIGEGWHVRAGQVHAEIAALIAADHDVRGADVFVSLEPCSHHGKTGPCATALIDAGVARVVISMLDPNPEVSGRGVEMLRQAGIQVLISDNPEQARMINSGFCLRMEKGRPLVRLKIAATLDGRTAASDGSSQWITGDSARKDVHTLRAMSCALITGIGTIRADNPRLNARVDSDVEQPLRVIVEGHHVVPPDAAIFNEAGRVLLVGPRSLPSRKEVPPGAEYLSVDSDHEKLDLGQLIKRLADQGCNEVLVEAGPTLAGAFVSAGLVDEIWIYQSPDIIGESGRGMFVMPGIKTIQEKISFELIDSRPVGGDVRSIYLPREKGL